MAINLPSQQAVHAIARGLATLGFAPVGAEDREAVSVGVEFHRFGPNGSSEQLLTIAATEANTIAIRFMMRSPFGDWVDQDLERLGLPTALDCRTTAELRAELRILLESLRRSVLPILDGVLGP